MRGQPVHEAVHPGRVLLRALPIVRSVGLEQDTVIEEAVGCGHGCAMEERASVCPIYEPPIVGHLSGSRSLRKPPLPVANFFSRQELVGDGPALLVAPVVKMPQNVHRKDWAGASCWCMAESIGSDFRVVPC